MATTSQKYRTFQGEPIGEKEVTAVAGIGDVLGERLATKGYDKAYVLLGQFLVLKKDKELFQDWLHEACNANAKQSKDCAECLAEYVKENL